MKNLISALDDIGRRVVAKARENLDAQRRNTTGTLKDSVRRETRQEFGTLITEVSHRDYGVYLDRGRRKGKYAPPRAIQNWVRNKGIETDERKVKTVAFLINRKIFQEGIKASQWLTRAIDFVTRDAAGLVDAANAKDGQVFINNLVNETNRRLR